MRLWRLTRAIHLDAPLSGLGATKHGGRWNSKGHAMVYTSESLELALLEALVHLDPDLIPHDIHQVCIELDDSFVASLTAPLPDGWDQPPPYRASVRSIGDRWLRDRSSVALAVPASVLPGRRNVLLNPMHKDFGAVRQVGVEPLPWPSRLISYVEQIRTPVARKHGRRAKAKRTH
jgi:RES domain-containing protein